MRGAQKAVKEASGMLYVGKKKNDCAIKSACSEKLIAWRKKRVCVCLHHRVAVSSLYNQQQQQESVSE